MAVCLLSYQFSTSPIPIQANPTGSTATTRINLGVFSRSAGVYCAAITVSVPVGVDPTDFCLEPPTASVNTGKWTIASTRIVSGADIGAPPGSYASITFQCRDQADYSIGYSLVLSLAGAANSAVGSFSYYLQELSGTSPDDLSPKTAQYPLSKQDPVFALRNFVATAASAPAVPATAFGNGQPVRLSWESNGTWFQLYTEGSPAPVYAGPATSYTLSPGLTTGAQFIVAASVTGDPGQDSPSPGYQAIYLYAALTLVVTNPDATPHSVTAGIVSAGILRVVTPAHPEYRVDVVGGQLRSSVGDNAAVLGYNASPGSPAAFFQNLSGNTTSVAGLGVIVAHPSNVGILTNGKIIAQNGMGMLTHLPTRYGHRVVTSPLVTEAEVHVSGSSRLSNGGAQVRFAADIADLVRHSAEAPYLVLLTPTSRCAGLVVVEKAPAHFVVEEAGAGRSDASFDWLVISRQPDSDGGPGTLALPSALPEPLPAAPMVPTPSPAAACPEHE